VGILPGDGALAAPHAITLEALQNDAGVLTRTVRVQNPGIGGGTGALAEDLAHSEQHDV
jgi:hypothetical protein